MSEAHSTRNIWQVKHGDAFAGKHTTEYRSWNMMIQRCHNPNFTHFHLYGARGISVCDSWRSSFVSFLVDMGRKPSPKHSIERIDNDGSYEPGNCRWATRKEQMRNTRCSRMIEFCGKTMCLSAWCEELGLSRRALGHRLNAGWSVEKAFTTPVAVRLK